mmetsp:Transcript_45248/g.106802  ORF Transcript_45248/g.106802 Transcript_45248/m.106802 type:complete len:180 (-) Transcript_45248:495-1034(-)
MAAPAYAAVLLATVLVIYCTIHEVPEGWVAVYYRGGALLDHVVPSGFAFKLPFITTVSFVQTMMQTDEVTNIPCGTRGGVLIFFDKIEVVNQLAKDHVLQTTRSYGLEYDKVWIFDKIHHGEFVPGLHLHGQKSTNSARATRFKRCTSTILIPSTSPSKLCCKKIARNTTRVLTSLAFV